MCSCHSVQECCVTFSGVKLSIRSFVLLLESNFADNFMHTLITLWHGDYDLR